MKYLDDVRLLVDMDKYEKYGVKKGWIGTILEPCLNFLGGKCPSFLVGFHPPGTWDDILTPAYVSDIELVKESDITDEELLEDISSHNPAKWCKVVDGYIMNLKGEKLNKIAYKYDSWGKDYED